MAKREVQMVGDYCPLCFSNRHPAPVCDHDSTKPCPDCGNPIGGLTKYMKGDVCWRCERARGGET
jgi:hypothetical protein